MLNLIIATLNEEEILEERLDRLRKTLVKAPPSQILLHFCDPGSTDSSKKMIEGFVQKNSFEYHFHFKELEKPSIARSFGLALEHCKQGLSFFLPADCSLDEKGIEELVRLSQKGGHPYFWGGFRKRYNRKSATLGFSLFVQNHIRARVFSNLLWTNGFFVGAQLLKELSWPDEGFLDDLLLCDRLKQHSKAIQLKPKGHLEVDARNYSKHWGVGKMLSNTAIVALHRSGLADRKTLHKIYRSGLKEKAR